MSGLWAGLCLVLAAYLVFREELLGFGWDRRFLDWPINPLVQSAGVDRLLMPLVLLGRYLTLSIVPVHLSLDYGGNVIGSSVRWHEPYVYLGVLSVVAWVIATVLCLRRKNWAVVFCQLALAISYGMVSNAIILIGTIFGERLMYLPTVFFIMLFAALLDWAFRRVRRADHVLADAKISEAASATDGSHGGPCMVVALLVCAWSVRTFAYARQWNDPMALYRNDLGRHPESMILHGLVANEYLSHGEFDKAREVGEDCLRRLPDCWQSYQMVVAADLKLHDFADAKRVLSHVDPRCAKAPIEDLRAAVNAAEK